MSEESTTRPADPPTQRRDDFVLSVRDLRVSFSTLAGQTDAVRGIDFELPRGKTLAIVGESGSGKSVTSYAILRLIQRPGRIRSGQILFRPKSGEQIDIAALGERDERLFKIRGGKIAMVFQEPMTALSPVHTIGNQLTEAVLLHRNITPRQADDLAAEMLERVGISNPRERLKQYPFEFSGGMRQRVVIAMALICEPEILIADEPTTALDVTVQAQILELMQKLQRDMNTSLLFITHDLGVVAQIADEIAVMRKGLIVERADVRTLFRNPVHPYTRELLAAVAHMGKRPTFADPPPPPAGLSFDEPEGTSIQGTMHELDGRRVLLFPRGGA